MTEHIRSGRWAWIGGGLAALTAGALVASCGGGGGGEVAGTGEAATIDAASVDRAMADTSGFVAFCQTTSGGLSASGSPVLKHSLSLLKTQRLRRLGLLPQRQAQALTSVQPADVLGSCGGRYGYTAYNHVSGVTTATLTFSDYCSTDSDTGQQQRVSGAVSFVNTATPTDSGPITTQWVGSTPGLTVQVRDAAGAQVSSQTLAFTDMGYTVGVPGGTPTAASPDTLRAASLSLTNNISGKAYQQTDYLLTMFDTADGGQQMSLTGRGYRSNGDWYGISTTTPMLTDADGNYQSGVMTFTGAGGANAVATLVPGALLQATLTVNGEPVSSLPACAR